MRLRFHAVAMLALGLLTGCPVGPNYKRPTAQVPTRFKEAAEGWKPAQPNDRHDRGPWWKRFGDPELDALEEKVARANQTVASYEAAYRRARAMVAEARASLFPTLGASGSVTRSKGAGLSTAAPGVGNPATSSVGNIYDLALDAAWEPDLWGGVRRQVAGAKASAQAAGSDLDNAKLSAQGTLAQSYFQLRAGHGPAAAGRRGHRLPEVPPAHPQPLRAGRGRAGGRPPGPDPAGPGPVVRDAE